MTQIPTPPASRSGSEAPEDDQKPPVDVASSTELLQSLDKLLERYLDLLDRHQKLQAELGKQLSSGFISLAHANYTCPPGRRYGVDYYDERMKAIRKISLKSRLPADDLALVTESENIAKGNPQTDSLKHIFRLETTSYNRTEEGAQNKDEAEENLPEPESNGDSSLSSEEHETKPPRTEDSRSSGAPETEDTPAPPKPKPTKKKFRSYDPITWYGILVPPSLRSAQKSFTEAVQGSLPELASVVVEMRSVEIEVAKLRKEIGQM